MNNKITKSQYMQLIGLKTVADSLLKQLENVEKAAMEITGEDDSLGHTSDMIYGSRELDEMLKLLKIEVEE